LGFGVWSLGFRVWSLGFVFWFLVFGFGVLGFGDWGLGFGFWGLGRATAPAGGRVVSLSLAPPSPTLVTSLPSFPPFPPPLPSRPPFVSSSTSSPFRARPNLPPPQPPPQPRKACRGSGRRNEYVDLVQGVGRQKLALGTPQTSWMRIDAANTALTPRPHAYSVGPYRHGGCIHRARHAARSFPSSLCAVSGG